MVKVALFVPCYMAALRPGDGTHALRVLERLGDEVTTIAGPCCGQPAFNSGYRTEAKSVGRALLRAVRGHRIVVVPSGSCTSMVQHYLPGLWAGPRGASIHRMSERFIEFGAYVAAHPKMPELPLRLPGAVAYHDSCHGRRELGLTEGAISLLEQVEGLDVRRLSYEAECCGFGGTFTLKEPEVSVAMAKAKLADVESRGVRVLVSGDLSCLAHLEVTARAIDQPLETWTLAELLDRAIT
ncbi:MAG TPA: Fe-S oxidoreductase [Dehalococcoidia bacterium]|nr:Fe-S oxidoreductase [Dehalococcoidia bacterium]